MPEKRKMFQLEKYLQNFCDFQKFEFNFFSFLGKKNRSEQRSNIFRQSSQ